MKSSSIAYRVADFLKQHPPFAYLDEPQLLDLAITGRVRFHESGELVCRQGGARKPHLCVIQQGKVRLVTGDGTDETLVDLLGAGDVIGLDYFLGASEYRYTARTESDVVIYTVATEDFEALVAAHPEISRYLAAYFSVNPATELAGAAPSEGSARSRTFSAWSRGAASIAERARAGMVRVPEDATIRQAAVALGEASAHAAAVVDAGGRPLGWVDDASLRTAMAGDGFSPEQGVREAMGSPLPLAPPGELPGSLLLRMIDADSGFIGITRDGTVDEPLMGFLGMSDLTRECGQNPGDVAGAVAEAKGLGELLRHRGRGDALVAAGLGTPDAAPWSCRLAAAFDQALFRRVVRGAEAELRNDGLAPPPLASCFLFFGSAGRGELFTRADLCWGLAFEDATGEIEAEAAAWYAALARRVDAGLAACGTGTAAPEAPLRVGPLSRWKERYDAWIDDPIGQRIHQQVGSFDLRRVLGSEPLARDLIGHVGDRIARDPGFVALLANDSMANLPPLTFFEGLVVDDAGRRSEGLDIVRCALQPLSDAARVLALDAGRIDASSTFDRLAIAAAAEPERQELLADATAGVRVALDHHARAASSGRGDGRTLDPTGLDKYDQQLLKSTFRSIVELLGYVALRFGLAPRR